MYIIIIVLLMIPALYMLRRGFNEQKKSSLAGGLLWGACVVLFFIFLGFWGEKLWFDALGFENRFWTIVIAKTIFALAGGTLSALCLFFMVGSKASIAPVTLPVGLVMGGYWGIIYWKEMLLYYNRVQTTLKEPIIGHTTGFYLFNLPFLDALLVLSVQIVGTGLVLSLISQFVALVYDGTRIYISEKSSRDESRERASAKRLYINGAILAVVLAFGAWLKRYHLLYSTWGTVTGPGWTDVHIRLPAYTGLTIMFLFAGCVLVWFAVKRYEPQSISSQTGPQRVPLVILGGAGVAGFLCWFLFLTVLPAFFQWLVVEPNEITREEPYIANNIKFTRQGFGLHRAEEKEFPASGTFDEETVKTNRRLLNNIRLWDRQALDAVYKQFQEIRLYYEFVGVDIDRYRIGDDYLQVMVSAREMQTENLPSRSQTFVNRRFKYTHGYGITLTPVSEFTPEGLPNLLIKDIPPKSAHPDIEIKEPRIYYGELTHSHVIADSSEEEFDYPRGEENVYNHYSGTGGVALHNLWRKFLFGWKFDGTRLLLSGYPTDESRILFHRHIQQRVKKAAPFLDFDDDPYIVLSKGRLFWIVDGYTTSDYYPYSESFYSKENIEYRNGGRRILLSRESRKLEGINYIRNSVKAVIDAYNGDIRFFVFDEKDPLIRAWRNVFPDLFLDKEKMPPDLLAHVRYPTDMLLAQGLVYASYHMTDPRVFYNQEDLWIRATEKYYNNVQPLQPYYVMWEMPGSDELQFILMLPFTPKKRQVMIGWMAAMCDAENYGRLLVYKFPKEKRVLGPQQVETKIDQDRFLSGQLTLWDQRGSNVIRGNVLAIPIEETIVYVEPIYLRAETAAYPELRLVVLMHNDILTYGPTFDQALQKLLEQTGKGKKNITKEMLEVKAPDLFMEQIREANNAFDAYIKQMGEERFGEAAESLSILRDILRRLIKEQ